MDNILLNHATKQTSEEYALNPPHALLVTADQGTGKGTFARHLSAQILGIQPDKLETYAYYRQVQPIDDTISIDAVRDIQQFMRLKTIGDKPVRRLLVIEQADGLTTEAQNALLKLLEEPPADTVIILTSANVQGLLGTIRSRARRLNLGPISRETAEEYFVARGLALDAINKAYHISEGRVGLMSAILAEDTAHPLFASIQTAKELLSLKPFERLARVDEISKQKAGIGQLLQALQIICHAALIQATQRGELTDIKRWHRLLKTANRAERNYQANPNTKLFVTDLLLNLQ